MPVSNGNGNGNGHEVRCAECGRVGTQRFEKVPGKRSKVCTDKVACLRRRGLKVTVAAKRDRAKRYPAQAARVY